MTFQQFLCLLLRKLYYAFINNKIFLYVISNIIFTVLKQLKAVCYLKDLKMQQRIVRNLSQFNYSGQVLKNGLYKYVLYAKLSHGATFLYVFRLFSSLMVGQLHDSTFEYECNNIMIERLQAVEEGLKLWRGIILILTVIMLMISFIGDDEMSIIVLIICFFALILFQLKNLPTSSYQLFILLQLAYFVFLMGKLFEVLYYKPEVAISSSFKNMFYMFTLVLFMIVLWRHYQKDQLIADINVDEVAADG